MGEVDPFDTIHLDPLAAGGPGRNLLARDIVGVFHVHNLVAGYPLFLHKLERAGADHLGDVLKRIGLGDAFRHDEGDVRRQFAEGLQCERERLPELESKSLVVHCSPRLDRLGELLAERIALAPALDRRAAIGRARPLWLRRHWASSRRPQCGTTPALALRSAHCARPTYAGRATRTADR